MRHFAAAYNRRRARIGRGDLANPTGCTYNGHHDDLRPASEEDHARSARSALDEMRASAHFGGFAQ
jgi:hypothetical protein